MRDAGGRGRGWPPDRREPGSVHVFVQPGRTRVVLCGDIDAEIGPELREAARDAAAAGLPVEVDARLVKFMDSSGVGMLGALAARTPGRPVIIRPPEVVRFLLDLTGIGRLVDLVDDADPAPGDLGGDPSPPTSAG